MARFEFATAARIVFGAGKLREVGGMAAALGTRALVVTGGTVERARGLLDALDDAGLVYITISVASEPDIELARKGAALAREFDAAMVIALGGGSAIDAGKAVAALATNTGDALEYLEVIGSGQPLTATPLPVIAIPTTAGTGAEVTRNAVLASPEHQVKVSLRHPLMLPSVALVDPELTYGLPKAITSYTGMDALTQVIEPFTSNAANPLTDAICREAIGRGFGAIRAAYEDDATARESMALVSLFGGLALANAKLGAVHGFAGVIGGMTGAPHGAICAALLPHVTRANIEAMTAREPHNPALGRYSEIGRMIGGDVVARLEELSAALAIPPLQEWGVRRENFGEIVAKSRNASSMKGNPIALTDAELGAILERAW